MEHRIPTGARFLGSLILLACAGGHLSGQTTPSSRASGPVDREFTLESTMLGYRGLGGEIDGVRNPNLWALTGETVRITIVNGETMVHDVAMEKADVRSAQILDQRRERQHHLQGERQRHLLLFAARPQGRRHGRTFRRLGPAACGRRRASRLQRGPSTWISRRARWSPGRRPVMPSRSSKPRTPPGRRRRRAPGCTGSAALPAAAHARGRSRRRRFA